MHNQYYRANSPTDATLAVILAGGRGSRLQGLTNRRAKPAVPFGGKYRLIDFALSNCLNSGIGKVDVLTQYMSHSLNQHIQQGWRMTACNGAPLVDLLPAQQRSGDDSWYTGTANALFQNLDILRSYAAEYILVLAGDHVYHMDYRPLIEQHANSGADVTICALESDRANASRFGVISADLQQRIVHFDEKPDFPSAIPGKPDKSLISMGVYIFNSEFLYRQLLEDHYRTDSEHDFGKNIIPHAVDNYNAMVYPFIDPNTDEPGYWRDVGTLDAYYQANQELLGILPQLNLYNDRWPTRTFSGQSPPAKFLFDSHDRCGAAVNSVICDGCIISGALINHSLMFNSVVANEHTEVNHSVLLPDVTIGPRCRIRKAIIDRHCHIPADTIIGYDPQQDAERFEISDNGVVLVTRDALARRTTLPFRRAA